MWDDFKRIIDSYDAFVITSHVNPDGDAIGSEVALRLFLEDLDKSAVVVNSSPTPDTLTFLDPEGEIRIFDEAAHAGLLDDVDAVIILDANNDDQVGLLARPLRKASLVRVCVDHHQAPSNDFAEVIVSDTSAAATGILVYDLIHAMGGEVTRAIADALYAALITDTGTFRFSNTDVRAFEVAADLTRRGADPFSIHRQVFGSRSWGAARVMGPVLSTVQSDAGGRLVWIHATPAMLERAGARYDDMDGFVDLVRAIKGVELVLFFKETQDGQVKVSLRSNGKVDAFAIAEHFGGGGHRMASGMRVDGPLDQAIEHVVSVCRQMEGIKGPA